MNDLQTGVKEICQACGNDRTRMMDIVSAVQARYGCVSEEAIDLIAKTVSTPRVQVAGLVSFYAFFSEQTKGKVVIRLCNDIIDRMHGSARSAQAFFDDLGITFGQTTPDGAISLESVPCIGLSDQARGRIMEALPAVSETLSFPDLGLAVKAIFKPRAGLYRALTDMYELGVLELLFPEFGSIKARVVRDFYHKYTVDEHSLLAIKNIEDLLTTRERPDLRFRSLLIESEDAELLTIALLLHDVGKSREGTHVDRSTSMTAKALRRYQFGREGFETVLFLVRNHLAMSSAIFRRDLDDPEVVRRFVDLVKLMVDADEELLRRHRRGEIRVSS